MSKRVEKEEEAAFAEEDRRQRGAILVIHGIGEQDPLEALGAFVRGIARQLNVVRDEMQHRLVWRDGRVFSMVRVPIREPVGRSGVTAFDVSEFYWAGLVQDRITLRQVLRWLVRTSLTPLRSWSVNAAVLFREQGAQQRRWWVLVRELLRSALLFAVAGGIVALFVLAAYSYEELLEAGKLVLGILASVRHPIWLTAFIAVVVMGGIILNEWRKLFRPRLHSSVEEQWVSAWWRRASFVAVAVLALLAWLIHSMAELRVDVLIWAIVQSVRPWPVLGPVIAVGITLVLRRPLIKFVGDIVLYVTADEKSTFFRTRAEIVDAATKCLRALLSSGEYAAVYVVGHSLGSVIAYDAINHVIREVRAEPEGSGKLTREELNRLRGLLTFGSPLDKVYYFFRTEVPDEAPVRAQLLSSLHAFRKQPSGRDYGSVKLARYEVPEPGDFRWVNVYSRADFVSAYLDYYRVDRQVCRPYVNPVTAHMKYWADPEFYVAVQEWL